MADLRVARLAGKPARVALERPADHPAVDRQAAAAR